jgi:hypothetical protein
MCLLKDHEASPCETCSEAGESNNWSCPQVVAIIDIDCAELNGFTREDQEALEELAELLARSCDFWRQGFGDASCHASSDYARYLNVQHTSHNTTEDFVCFRTLIRLSALINSYTSWTSAVAQIATRHKWEDAEQREVAVTGRDIEERRRRHLHPYAPSNTKAAGYANPYEPKRPSCRRQMYV